MKVDPRDVHDRKKWRAIRRHKANLAASGTPPKNGEEDSYYMNNEEHVRDMG